jgi:cytochrome b involved in lipid metabolism
MLPVAGKDATKKFHKYHRKAILPKHKPQLLVGILVPDTRVEIPEKAVQETKSGGGLFKKFGKLF